MANTSILSAFERMWQHVVVALNGKSDADHTHSWNDLEDKPFGEGEGSEVLFDGNLGQYWQLDDTVDGGGFWNPQPYFFSKDVTWSEGTYTVTVNGTVYRNVTAVQIVDDASTSLLMGNLSIMGYDIGVDIPWSLAQVLMYNEACFLAYTELNKPAPSDPTQSVEETVSVKIESGSGIKQLDNKYLEILEGSEATGSDTITWDGNTEGLELFNANIGADFYRVSDTVPSIEEIKQGGTVVSTNVGSYEFGEGELTIDGNVCMIGFDVIVLFESDSNGEKGIYFLNSTTEALGIGYTSSLTINGYSFGGSGGYKIKAEYLPSSLYVGDDVVNSTVPINADTLGGYTAEEIMGNLGDISSALNTILGV